VQNKTVEDFLNDEELSAYKQLKGNDARRIFIQEAGKKHFDLFVYIQGYRDVSRETNGEYLRNQDIRGLFFKKVVVVGQITFQKQSDNRSP